jgi:hypothetical protein
MAKSISLTYGQLYVKLKELGFEESHVELDGKRGRMFERKDLPASLIVLPERPPNDPVEYFHVGGALLTLKRLHLLPEYDPLDALGKLQNDVPAS